MVVRAPLLIAAGAIISCLIALVGARASDTQLAASLEQKATAELARIDGGVTSARFVNRFDLPTRHPVLSGGEELDEVTRDQLAKAVAAIPGVGGIQWSDGSMMAASGILQLSPLHCQEDVQILLRARSIRFEESSSELTIGSDALLDEVAAALRPCLGAIIAITGHTDASGPEDENIALSKERAKAVRTELAKRGISSSSMEADGRGSSEPVENLAPTDPANRRIEFTVVSTRRLQPTPIDTPGPR